MIVYSLFDQLISFVSGNWFRIWRLHQIHGVIKIQGFM